MINVQHLTIRVNSSNARIIKYVLLLTTLIFAETATAQRTPNTSADSSDHGIYKVNYWASIPALAVGVYITAERQERLNEKPRLSLETLNALDPAGVWGIDRVALRQPLNRYEDARETSDFGIEYFVFAPVLLFIDKKIRKDALDVAIVYAETNLVMLSFYNWSFLGPSFIERIRPVAYYEDITHEERSWPGNRNSFFSGHTATVANTTYFMVRTYFEAYPEQQAGKWWLYAVAAIPPTFIGIKRIQGLKHFPSDVIIGGIVGAASGLFWPKLHRVKNGQRDISFLYSDDFKVIRVVWQI